MTPAQNRNKISCVAPGPDGRLKGHYRISRSRPAFFDRLAYFGLDRAWMAALEEAEG